MFVARCCQLFEKILHIFGDPPAKLNKGGLECTVLRRGLVEACARCNNEKGDRRSLDLRKQCEPFRGDFRIRQNVVDRGKFSFRQEMRGRMPIQQAFMEQFLGMNAGTKNPKCLVDMACDGSDEKCLRRLDDMRKCYRASRSLNCVKSWRDWFALRNNL
ncbi:MAG: hypothetical protein DME91_03010 [Verrucomicrobia bacterium]|nr:MAG: hypothetical protein DME91_03010 [Verrucomicrobiota bacterium]